MWLAYLIWIQPSKVSAFELRAIQSIYLKNDTLSTVPPSALHLHFSTLDMRHNCGIVFRDWDAFREDCSSVQVRSVHFMCILAFYSRNLTETLPDTFLKLIDL